MPCDIWFLGVGIYFGCTIWLRRWDFSLPSHSLRTVRVSSAVASGTRLGILALCGVSRRKNDTQSFLLARRLFARPRSARGRITSKVVCALVTSEAKRKADAMHLLFFLVAEAGFEPHDLRVMSTLTVSVLLTKTLTGQGFDAQNRRVSRRDYEKTVKLKSLSRFLEDDVV